MTLANEKMEPGGFGRGGEGVRGGGLPDKLESRGESVRVDLGQRGGGTGDGGPNTRGCRERRRKSVCGGWLGAGLIGG